MVGVETDKKANDFQTSLMRRNAKKSNSVLSKNRSLTLPENCMVFTSSLILMDGEFKDIMKNARKKLEVPMPAAMPCKIQPEKYRETCCVEKKCKTKYVCNVEADEAMSTRMEGSQRKNHEDHIPGKGINSLSHCNPVHKFILMLEAMKILDAKAAVEKE